MTLKHFIERPVLASVISIVIVIAGLIGLATLPVEQYPDIAPPTVMVHASYPGASAETIQKSVIVPLEQAINGVEDMTYMTSSAAVGSASVTVYFRQGINADMAAVNVQNRISRATGQLPSEVTQIGVTTMKRQTSMVKIFSLYSPDDSYDETFLSNYLKINIEPRVLRIAGVGEAFTLGADYSMRIWLKPDVMAQYKLIPSDVTAALAEQNIESATGTLGENSQNTFQYTMKYRGRLMTPEEFGEIVLLAQPDGTILHLSKTAAHRDIPVLGVNLGSLGFMAELESKDLLRLRDLCDGKYEIESHMMLDVSVQRDGRVIYSNLALNEALIARGNISRVIRLQIFTEQGKLVDVAGDGVIVASPTGSTAYSLSAGGPVVEPTARNFIVSPICAHSVHANAYVLSPERVITVQTEKNSYTPVLLSVDGGRAFSLRSGDSIEVRRSKFDTKLVRLRKRSFCEILQKKMLMGGTSNEE